MTFLELCQMTAQQSGTIQGTLPTTVVGQTNRLKQIVDFVREAYIDIQNAHRGWRWLNSEFYGFLGSGVLGYDGSTFYDERTETLIGERFSQWGLKGDGSDTSVSMYQTSYMGFIDGIDIIAIHPGANFEIGARLFGVTSHAQATVTRMTVTSGDWNDYSGANGANGEFEITDVSGTFRYGEGCTAFGAIFSGFYIDEFYIQPPPLMEEGTLRPIQWDEFYELYTRGVKARGKPQIYSISTDNKMHLSPLPDTSAWRIRGKYRKGPQILVNDSDVPEMPKEFHTLIKDAALAYLEGFDEGPRIPLYRLRMLPNFSMLEAHQLPKVLWGASLA